MFICSGEIVISFFLVVQSSFDARILCCSGIVRPECLVRHIYLALDMYEAYHFSRVCSSFLKKYLCSGEHFLCDD